MKSFRVGSAFGIPIKLDLTFLLILPIFAYVIGLQLGQWVIILNETMGLAIDPDTLTATTATRYGIGTAAAIGLFVSVLFHEFGHSLVARRYDVPIRSITLWLLGGVAQMEEIPEDWKKEFNIAIAGPIVSIATGVVAYALFLVIPAGGFTLEATRFTLAYLAVMNVFLAAFNMLPGFPMDGGRVLRALLARNRPHAQATQQAARVGQLFAIMLGLFGLLAAFNIFLIILAFFIYIAASSEATQTVMNAAFSDIDVRDVMTPREKLDVVTPETTVAELTERMLRERHTGYPVVDNGRVVGIVTLSDAREITPVERDAYRVADVMTRELHTTTPETSVMDAFGTMQKNRVGRLLVLDEREELAGLISRTDVMTAFDIIKSSGSLGADSTSTTARRDSA